MELLLQHHLREERSFPDALQTVGVGVSNRLERLRVSVVCSAVQPAAKEKTRASGEVHVGQFLDPACSTKKVHSLDDVLDLAHLQDCSPRHLVHCVDLESSAKATELLEDS